MVVGDKDGWGKAGRDGSAEVVAHGEVDAVSSGAKRATTLALEEKERKRKAQDFAQPTKNQSFRYGACNNM